VPDRNGAQSTARFRHDRRRVRGRADAREVRSRARRNLIDELRAELVRRNTTSSKGRERCIASRSTECSIPSYAERIDEIIVDDVVDLVAELVPAGYKRETIKKSRDCLAMVLDHYEISPSPARDPRIKLPRERKAHVPPPLAEHVERFAEPMPRHHVLPLLSVDECGPRARELETAQVGDVDEHRKAIRVRWTVEKNDRYRHLELPDDSSRRCSRRCRR
jgi:integrase